MINKDLYWPIGISLTLILFVGGLISAVLFSTTVPINLVSNDYYENGLNYEEKMEQYRQSAVAAKHLTVEYDPQEKVLLLNYDFKRFHPQNGTVYFYRPSDSQLDQSQPLNFDESGQASITLGELAKGFWRIKIQWEESNQTLLKEDVLVIE
jgi:nitrogen fixation protein FixH